MRNFPQSLQIKVTNEKKIISSVSEKRGVNYKYFDVASLTKIMVTVPLVMKLYDEDSLRLSDPVSKYLGFFKKTPVGDITLRELLSHTSGLVWWRPYFKELIKIPMLARSSQLKKILARELVSKTGKCVYSDPDFIILGWVIEELYGLPLDEAATHFIFDPLKLHDTFFVNSQKSLKNENRKKFAPTEKTEVRGTIQGVVHDDNAWALGGVSGHAGVFSTIDDVSKFAQELLKAHLGLNKTVFKTPTVRLFLKRAVPKDRGDWALGFMVPTHPTSSGGALISPNSFGHTGFTGTSIWIDVRREITVSILSNRTFPTRKDESFKAMRAELHDEIWKSLGD